MFLFIFFQLQGYTPPTIYSLRDSVALWWDIPHLNLLFLASVKRRPSSPRSLQNCNVEAVRTCLPPPGIQIALQCSSPPTETDFLHRLRGNQAHGSWIPGWPSFYLHQCFWKPFWTLNSIGFGFLKTGYSCGIALPLGKMIANRDVCSSNKVLRVTRTLSNCGGACSSKKVLRAILSHSQFGTFCFSYENTMALQVQEGSKVWKHYGHL